MSELSVHKHTNTQTHRGFDSKEDIRMKFMRKRCNKAACVLMNESNVLVNALSASEVAAQMFFQ